VRRSALALIASALLAPTAAAAVSATVSECPSGSKACDQRIHLVTQGTAAPGVNEMSIFVGIMALVDGQPNPGVAGWYDGRRWTTGKPTAAWTGRPTRSQAAIPVPGGVCGLVRQSGGPAGSYGVFVGWGSADRLSSGGGLDMAEVREMIANAPPDEARRLRELMQNYQEATKRAAEYDSGGMSAFMDMRQRKSFNQIKTFDCQGSPR